MLPFHVSYELNVLSMGTFIFSVLGFYLLVMRQGDRIRDNRRRIDALQKRDDELQLTVTAHATAFSMYQLTIAQDYMSVAAFERYEERNEQARKEMKEDLIKAIGSLGDRLDKSILKLNGHR